MEKTKGGIAMELTHIAARSARLSAILREDMRLSAGLMNRLKWDGRLQVNGVPARTNHPVEPGDRITVLLDEATPAYPAEDIPVTVLYEDEYILAVDKPAGMLIHPSHSRNTGTLANAVAGYYCRMGLSAAFHPITRLDRDTYGVVLLGKNSYAHALLSGLQDRGELTKLYEAAVLGSPPTEGGTVDAPIARRPLPSLLRYIDESGKPSLTRYRLLRREEGYSILELQPVTGRTHQLRLHCAHIGCPILGDPQYGNAASSAVFPDLRHQLLCASELRFPHPVTGQMLCIRSKLDALYPVREAYRAEAQ